MLSEAAERERMQCFYRVHSGMEITPLHYSRTGRGRAAPRCAAVLEQGLMAGRALGHGSQLALPVCGVVQQQVQQLPWSWSCSLPLPEKQLRWCGQQQVDVWVHVAIRGSGSLQHCGCFAGVGAPGSSH